MVQYESSLSRTFAALSDPTRRSILDRLADGSATISELAEPAGMSLTGLKKHVRILEEANLVTTEKRGRVRHCHFEPKGFDEAGFWMEEFRRRQADRFDRLEQIIERKKAERNE
ncbi:MAG: metalloregulator ArsR/SmtB family transcription factor [Actinomycetota bacterium]|nr:metalloregulator ArsR/SmtB family transcription factor [Actinomycetota bacterium]